MALGSALVDRAYILRKQADGRKVEGTTVFAPSESPVIRARLTLNQPGERREDGRVFTEPTPTLLLLRNDAEGNPVEIKASDRLRVESEQLGTHNYEVQGDVQPGRKRRRVICWTATLKRLDELDAAGL